MTRDSISPGAAIRLHPPRRRSPERILLICLLLVFIARLLTLEYPALIDPTEGRYASVAQTMLATGDWITPHVWMNGQNVPYLGKPPLHFWLTAIVYLVGGLDEWSARLASFFSLLIVCSAIWTIVWRWSNARLAFVSTLVCSSSAVMFFFAGASVVDVTLAACVAGAVIGFAIGLEGSTRYSARWIYGGYVSLGLALLAKGPVGIVLTATVLVPWAIFLRQRLQWNQLRVVRGLGLMLVVAAPWYVLAERANPGFLRYFLLNENLLRFFVRDYGDRYGSGHVYPYGSAWWMMVAAFLPWTPILVFRLYQQNLRSLVGEQRVREKILRSPLMLLALCWAFGPLMFLTFIRQLQIGYLIPAIPGFAILTALVLRLQSGPTNFTRIGIRSTLLACIYGAVLLATDAWISEHKSTNMILLRISELRTSPPPQVAFVNWTAYSSQFYAAAWEEELLSPVTTAFVPENRIMVDQPVNLVIESQEVDNLPSQVLQRYTVMLTSGKWSWLKLKEA